MSKSISQLASIEFVGRLIGQASQYGMSIVIARSLGANGLGQFAFGFIILQISGAVARAGLDTALLKFIPIDRENVNRLTGTTLISLIGATLIGILVVIGYQFAAVYIPAASKFSIHTPVGLMLIGIPFFALIRITEAGTRGFNQNKYAVLIREFGMRGLGLLFVLIALVLAGSIYNVVGAFVIALAIAAIIGIVLLKPLGAYNGIGSPVFCFNRVLTYALPVAGVAIANPMVIWSDILMLGFLSDANQVGLYRSAYQTASLLTFALISVNAVFPPLASRLYNSGNLDQLQTIYTSVTLWITGLTIFAAEFIIIYGRNILTIFGSEFTAASTVLIALAVGRVTDAGVGPAGFLLSMTNNERLELMNTIGVAVLNLILNYILIGRYGILGAAVATTISLSLLNIIRIIEIRRFIGIWPYSKRSLSLIWPLTTSLIIMVVGKQLSTSPIVQVIIVGFVSFSFFVGLSWQTVLSKEDKILAKSI